MLGIPTDITGCRPECIVSSECPADKACMNNKCINPCSRNVCGIKATCKVLNHSPLCSCIPPLIGNPLFECYPQSGKYILLLFHINILSNMTYLFTFIVIEIDPCSSSPCNYNGECKVRNDVAYCIYPECIINSDCPREKACLAQKCRDPCVNACGIDSICQTINHKPVCSCPSGFMGNPYIKCMITTHEGNI